MFKRLRTLSTIEIFIVITVITLTIFLVKFFGLKSEYRTIRVEVIKKNWVENYDPYGYRAPFWLSDKIKVGQIEKDNGGKVIATLTSLDNFERGGEEAEIYLTLNVKVAINQRTGQITFKDKPLDLGGSIELNLSNIAIEGQIIDNNLPITGYPTKNFIVTLRGRNLDPWIYSKISPGLTMYNRANHDPIVTITDVKLEPATFQPIKFDNSQTHLIAVNNEQNKDAIITAKIKAYQIDGKWFFSGHQNLKANNKLLNLLYIYTDKVNLYELELEDIQEAL